MILRTRYRTVPPVRKRVATLLSSRRAPLPKGPPRWWRLVSSLLFSGSLLLVGSVWYLGQRASPTEAADQPNPTVSYQGKLSDSSGSAVANGMQSAAFAIYAAASGGTALWTETWGTSTSFQTSLSAQSVTSSVSLTYTAPTTTDEANLYVYHTLYNINRRDQVTVTAVDTGTNTITITPTAKTWESGDYITNKLVTFDGLFSVRLPATSTLEAIFNQASTTRLFLGVNINGDGEMQPRKQITFAPLAINALYLGGVPSTSFARLDIANTFATTTFTGSPGGTAVNQGGLYVNPASPGADQTLLGIANNGSERLRVDAEGDVFASGTLSVLAIKTTSSNPLLVYGGAADSYVQVGQTLPAAYRGLAATSSDDLFVADQLYVDGLSRLDGAVYSSSTLTVTGATSLHGSLTVRNTLSLPDSTAQLDISAVKANGSLSASVIYVNAAVSSVANGYVIGLAHNGTERFKVDIDGDVYASGTIHAFGLAATGTTPLLLYGGGSGSYVQTGSSLPSAYRGFSATTSKSLFVTDDLYVSDVVRMDGAVSASSSLQVTGASTFYNDVTVQGTLIIPDTGGGLSVGTVGVDFANWVNFNAAGYVDNWEKAPVAITAASADPMSFLLGAGTGGTEAFSVRAGGYVFASGTYTGLGLTGLADQALAVQGGGNTGYVLIGGALPAGYRGLPATSTRDLFVAGAQFVDGTALFDGGVWASSTLQVGDLSTFYATSTYAAGGIQIAGLNITNSGALGSKKLIIGDASDATPYFMFELDGSTAFIDSSSYVTFRDSISFDSSGDVYYIPNGMTLGNGGTNDSIDFRDDANSSAVGNINLDLDRAFPIISSPNTATTSIADTLLVSSTDSFYIRSIVNTSNVASRMAFDDTNDEFIIDVQTSSTGAGPLDVAVKLDDQAAGLSYFRVRSSTTAVWSVDSAGTVGAGGSDVAERYPSAELLLPGDVVAADPTHAGYIRRATGGAGESIIGVVSTKPAIILGFYDAGAETLGYDVALVGRVPVRVTDENGPISIGDLLTLGSEPGTAVRRVGGGVALGTALEALATSSAGSVTTFINVSTQPDVLEVVPSASRAAGLKVYRFAPYAGTIEVASLVVTESIEVRGSVRVRGSLQLDGAVLTEFWDASDGALRVGDAAAIVGPNEVDRTWADRSPTLPAIGVVAEVVPIEQVDATTTLEYLTLLASRGQLVDPSQLRRLRVAVGGTLAGFTGLLPGTRYYLATQPPYPSAGTSSQEALAAEAPTAVGVIQQLLGIARDERSLLLFVSPQYKLNEPPPAPVVITVPVPSPAPQPSPQPPEKPQEPPPEATPAPTPSEPSP